MRTIRSSAGILLLAATVGAQMPQDTFLMYGFNLDRVAPSSAWFFDGQGQWTVRTWLGATVNGTAMAVEDGEVLYFAVPGSLSPPGPISFYRVTVGPNQQTIQETLLGTYANPTQSFVTALAVAGDNLWFVTRPAIFQTRPGLVGTLSKSQTGQTVTTVLDLGAAGYPQKFFEARSNGRDVFVWGFPATPAPAIVLALDTSSIPPPVRVVPVPLHTSYANGKLLGAAPSGTPGVYQFTLVDPLTLASTPIPLAYYSPPPDSVAYNPWTRTLLMRDFTLIGSDVWLLPPATGQWIHVVSTLQNGYGAFLLPIHEEPVLVYGRGCPNATGRDPRMTWSGLPERGGQLTLVLVDAERASPAVFWIGHSRTFWAPAGILPYEASPLGAPSCHLLASPDLWEVCLSNSNGVAELPVQVPNHPALIGLRLFAQTGSRTSVNALGFAASDALELRFR